MCKLNLSCEPCRGLMYPESHGWSGLDGKPVSIPSEAQLGRLHGGQQTFTTWPQLRMLWNSKHLSASVDAVGASRISLDWIARSGRTGLVAVDSVHPDRDCGQVRLRRTPSVSHPHSDPSRLTATHPPPRKPLARTRGRSPAPPACLNPTRRGLPPRIRSRWRQLKSSTRPLAGCGSPLSVQLTPKSLFHHALSRSDRLSQLHGVTLPEIGGTALQ